MVVSFCRLPACCRVANLTVNGARHGAVKTRAIHISMQQPDAYGFAQEADAAAMDATAARVHAQAILPRQRKAWAEVAKAAETMDAEAVAAALKKMRSSSSKFETGSSVWFRRQPKGKSKCLPLSKR